MGMMSSDRRNESKTRTYVHLIKIGRGSTVGEVFSCRQESQAYHVICDVTCLEQNMKPMGHNPSYLS
jgi:hypothetical protein